MYVKHFEIKKHDFSSLHLSKKNYYSGVKFYAPSILSIYRCPYNVTHGVGGCF